MKDSPPPTKAFYINPGKRIQLFKADLLTCWFPIVGPFLAKGPQNLNLKPYASCPLGEASNSRKIKPDTAHGLMRPTTTTRCSGWCPGAPSAHLQWTLVRRRDPVAPFFFGFSKSTFMSVLCFRVG